jgi:large conductance mechanosensitive channel
VIHGKEIPYGLFLGEVVNFLIIAAALFLFIVKFLGWLMRTRQEEAATPPPPTKEEMLLTEIRDLLREEVQGNSQRRS